MATNQEMKIEFNFFRDVWNFFKKFYDVQDTENFWESAVNEAAEISEKYNCQLCKALLIAVAEELQRKGERLYERV